MRLVLLKVYILERNVNERLYVRSEITICYGWDIKMLFVQCFLGRNLIGLSEYGRMDCGTLYTDVLCIQSIYT